MHIRQLVDLCDDGAAAGRLTTSAPLPVLGYCKSSADCGSTVDEPLLLPATSDEIAGPEDAALWENFADLEFPRDALSLIDTLGTSNFGEVSIVTFADAQQLSSCSQ